MKRWVRHTACKHYCVNWDTTRYSVVERLKFSHKKSLHLRQSTLKDGGTNCLQNQGTRLSRYMASHATMPECRVTTMRISNLCSKLCDFMQDICDLFKKYPTFGWEKIRSHAWRSAILISFKVVYLWLKTLLPAVPPLFKAFLESLFVNGVQFARRVSYNVVSRLKLNPFQLRFQVGVNPKIARSHIGRVGRTCWTTGMLCLAKKFWIGREEWACAL